ncbi:hypothetical protein [Aliikangiella sp. G2MR2-5]|uniref:hypothetical protein n=1 Tax=Aliikangiella sp. G2MR2-5 TaxID=2788943 RepID=UPI0018AC3067|nr:hypothetical protein [Aliikangiella sp. G2MR2-5]
MKSLTTKISALTFIALFSGPILAGTPVLDNRQDNQKARIKQGVKNGELTNKEAKKLIQGQRQLQKMELKAKSDGVVTQKERAKLQHKANIESAKIAKIKHDRQDRKP